MQEQNLAEIPLEAAQRLRSLFSVCSHVPEESLRVTCREVRLL